MRTLLPALLIATSALALQGCPSCPYEEACDGNTLKWCYLGVDQLVGSPEEGERECVAPNPVCITLDDQNALCAIDRSRTCERGAEFYCEGNLKISCGQGFEVAEDCAAHGNVCGLVDGEAHCYEDPLTPCEPTLPQTCEGAVRRHCYNGQVTLRDCALEGEGWTCNPSPSGTGTFCGPPQ